MSQAIIKIVMKDRTKHQITGETSRDINHALLVSLNALAQREIKNENVKQMQYEVGNKWVGWMYTPDGWSKLCSFGW